MFQEYDECLTKIVWTFNFLKNNMSKLHVIHIYMYVVDWYDTRDMIYKTSFIKI